MRDHKLKSGRTLRVQPADFRKSKTLFDAVAKEIKAAHYDAKQEIDINFIKNTLLGLISSEAVEVALWPCMTGVLVGTDKVTPEFFEKSENREDFLEICYEVAKENVIPFMKNLSSKFEPILKELGLNL